MKGRRNVLSIELITSIIEVDPVTGCWNCRDVNKTHGYGQVKINYKNWRAHRASWTAFKGPIPKGVLVLHKCDNRPCCNPKHLYLGNNSKNVQDMYERDRANPAQGSRHGLSKLTDKSVTEIFHLVSSLGFKQSQVAKKYRVTASVISRIMNGKTWTHLNLVPDALPRYQYKYAERRTS